MSKTLQTRLLAIAFGALLTFTVVAALSFVTGQMGPSSDIAGPTQGTVT